MEIILHNFPYQSILSIYFSFNKTIKSINTIFKIPDSPFAEVLKCPNSIIQSITRIFLSYVQHIFHTTQHTVVKVFPKKNSLRDRVRSCQGSQLLILTIQPSTLPEPR